MMGPAVFTAFDYIFSLPMFARFHRKPDMKQCLTNYYRKVGREGGREGGKEGWRNMGGEEGARAV